MSYKRRRAITFVYWPFTPTDGFATRCEARLCLAVRAQLEVGACPRCGLWPKNSWGEARTAGLAPC